jgi:hypothetical protein
VNVPRKNDARLMHFFMNIPYVIFQVLFIFTLLLFAIVVAIVKAPYFVELVVLDTDW